MSPRGGCILLSVGQDEFHGEALHTLDYVVHQSDYTVQTLRNITQYLSLAKTVNVAQVYLPSDVEQDIDKLNIELNSAADTLMEETSENSGKITRVFNAMYELLHLEFIFLILTLVSAYQCLCLVDIYCRRSALITLAAVMLLVSLLGLCMYYQRVPFDYLFYVTLSLASSFNLNVLLMSVALFCFSPVSPWAPTCNSYVSVLLWLFSLLFQFWVQKTGKKRGK